MLTGVCGRIRQSAVGGFQLKPVKKTRVKATVCASATAFAMFGLAISGAAAATYTTFDVPESSLTEPAAINDNGDVVGVYFPSAGGFFTGFLRASDGTFTSISVPNSGDTSASAISSKGVIAGSWDDLFGSYGFVRKPSGKISTIDRGERDTGGLRINDSGEVAGNFTDERGAEKGFVRPVGERFKGFGVKGAFLTRVAGINSAGAVIGYFVDASAKYVGFVRAADGTVTKFRVSRAPMTMPVAINDSGAITGYYQNGDTFSGFVRSADGTIETFDPPSSLQTNPAAINRKGEIAGAWFDGSQFHSFVRSPNGKITSFDPPNAKGSQVNGINSKGEIVGTWSDEHAHGYIRTP